MMQDIPKLWRKFWIFHGAFWAVAGFLLFLSGWMQGGVFVSLVRNLYLAGVGLLLAWPLMMVLAACRGRDLLVRLLAVGAACYVASLLTVLVINPVTFTQLGMPLDDITARVLTAGALNYAMVLALWCLLHEMLMMRDASVDDAPSAPLQTLAVQKGKTNRSLDIATIDWISAAGDYVEIHAGGETFLKRATMASMIQALPEGAFLRVHRSCIVAVAAVVATEGKSKGAYQLRMRDDKLVETGRSYQAGVEAALLS